MANKYEVPADAESASPEDWCYVYNFNAPDRPQILKIRRGWGKTLKADMERLVQSLQREAKKMFESDEFAEQLKQTAPTPDLKETASAESD
jgi:hypothetical protein